MKIPSILERDEVPWISKWSSLSAVISLVSSEGEIHHVNDREREVGPGTPDRTRSGVCSDGEKVDLCISDCDILHQRKRGSCSRRGAAAQAGWEEVKGEEGLLASALLRLLSSCCLNRSTRANQLLSIAPRLCDVIPQEPGLPDTANIPVPGLRPLRPGSLFTWGHCNANSLSLSIREKITVEAKVAGQRRAKPGKREAAKGWNQQCWLMRGEKWVFVLLWTGWTVVRAFVRGLYCCQRGQRGTISNRLSETPRNASERSAFIHAAQNIDSVFYF